MWSDRAAFVGRLLLSVSRAGARYLFRGFCAALAVGLVAATPAGAIVGTSEIDTVDTNRVVTLLTKGPDGAGFCSAVVLRPRVVLTAAHCVRSPQDVAVLTRAETGEPKLSPAKAIERHPQYRADAVVSRRVSVDIALVLLASPLGDDYLPMTIGEGKTPAVGETITVLGYGVTRAGDTKSGGVLHRARLLVRAPLSDVLLWADGGDDPTGACSGDSGAPLIDENGDLIAVVAWADGGGKRGCGGLTQGPLLRPVRGWIDEVTRRWGS